MKEEAQRIAIAKLEGRLKRGPGEIVKYQRWDPPNAVYQLVKFPDGSERSCYIVDIPNYTHDRNTINKVIADKVVGFRELEQRFLKDLDAILDRRADDETTTIFEYEMAQITASEREFCEALLRTIGKWEDE